MVDADVNEFGAFLMSFTVPADVDYNVHTVLLMNLARLYSFPTRDQRSHERSFQQQFQASISSSVSAYGSVPINIADPRIPTGASA